MLILEDDVAVTLICTQCGGPILPGQPFLDRDECPVHSESADCNPDEGWNPHMEVE